MTTNRSTSAAPRPSTAPDERSRTTGASHNSTSFRTGATVALMALGLTLLQCSKSIAFVPDACLDNQFRCEDASLRRCNANRSGYDLVKVCPSGTTCSEALGACSEQAPLPGETTVAISSATLPSTILLGTSASLIVKLSRSGPMTTPLRATVTGVAGVTSATALVAPTEDSVTIELDTSTTAVQGDATFKITLTNDGTGSFVTAGEAKTFLRGRPGSIDTTYGTLGYAAPKALAWSDLFVLSTGETLLQAYTQSFGNTIWSAEVLSSNGRASQSTFALPSFGLGGLTANVDRADRLVTFGGRQGQGTLSRFAKDGAAVPFKESSLPLYGGVVKIAAINDETFLVLHDAVIKFDAAGVKVYEAQAPAPSVDVPNPGSPIGIWRLDGKDVLSTSGGGSTLFWGRGGSGNFDSPAGTFFFAPEAKGLGLGPGPDPYYLTSRCAVKSIQGTLCLEPNEATTLLTSLYFSTAGKAALFGRRLVSGSPQYVVRFFDQNARELLEISLPNDAKTLAGGFFGEDHFVVSSSKGVVRYWL